MRNNTRQLIRDLKAATLLGNPEAVDIALNGLLDFPGVVANDRMSDGFIEKTILPVGKALAPLKASHLRPLLNHKLAAGRAIGAVGLADRFVIASDTTPKDLFKPANDPRLDVRVSLGRELLAVGSGDPQKTYVLGSSWLMKAAPKPRYTALVFLPGIAESHGERIVGLLDPLCDESDYEVRAALVAALNALALAGLKVSILELLMLWASDAQPNVWVISRVLSSSWVAAYPVQAKAILEELSKRPGASSQVKRVVEALARHGLEINI